MVDIGFWVFGAVLVVTGVFLDSRWFLATGLLLFSTVLLAGVYKAHLTAIESRRNRREIRDISKSVGEILAKSKRDQTRARASNTESQTGGQSLVSNGGNKDFGNSKNARIRSTENPTDVSRGGYHLTFTYDRKPRLCVIASSALLDFLEPSFNLAALQPGVAEAVFEAEGPVALVIDERALQEGSWSGALKTTANELVREVLRLKKRALAQRIPVYVLPSSRVEVASRELRSAAVVVVDSALITAYEGNVLYSDNQLGTAKLTRSLVAYVKN